MIHLFPSQDNCFLQVKNGLKTAISSALTHSLSTIVSFLSCIYASQCMKKWRVISILILYVRRMNVWFNHFMFVWKRDSLFCHFVMKGDFSFVDKRLWVSPWQSPQKHSQHDHFIAICNNNDRLCYYNKNQRKVQWEKQWKREVKFVRYFRPPLLLPNLLYYQRFQVPSSFRGLFTRNSCFCA